MNVKNISSVPPIKPNQGTMMTSLHHMTSPNDIDQQGWKLPNDSAFPSEKCRKDLLVRHYFCLSPTNRQRVISIISAFPSEKCLKFLLVRLRFYLSRTGGQSVISIPDQSEKRTMKCMTWEMCQRCPRVFSCGAISLLQRSQKFAPGHLLSMPINL